MHGHDASFLRMFDSLNAELDPGAIHLVHPVQTVLDSLSHDLGVLRGSSTRAGLLVPRGQSYRLGSSVNWGADWVLFPWPVHKDPGLIAQEIGEEVWWSEVSQGQPPVLMLVTSPRRFDDLDRLHLERVKRLVWNALILRP